MDAQSKKYHFIGIGGIGMSALARILLEKNILVSGSDLSSNETTQMLVEKGAVVRHGHSAAYITRKDIVVYSSAISYGNPEFQAAKALNCPMMHRSELLAQLMQDYQSLAVTGAHGKTTTASLLATVLMSCNCDPSFALGGLLDGENGKSGKGRFFVAEADESDGSFLKYHPEGAIITNISKEHLDHYKSFEELSKAFATFIAQTRDPSRLFYCGDDPILSQLAKGKGLSYGFSKECDLRILCFSQEGWQIKMDLSFEGKEYKEITVPLIGEYNALNAAAVFGMAIKLGLDVDKIRKALNAFLGVSRRCQKRGEAHQVLLLDDYAHHPVEIEKTLKALKCAIEDRRLVVLFQPHRYTRVNDLLESYGSAFEWADYVYVTDVYAAGEAPIVGVNAERLLEMMQKKSTVPCSYLPREKWVETIKEELHPHDVFVTLGAGDICHLHEALLRDFSPKKSTVGLVFGGLSCEHEISLRSARFVAESLDPTLYNILYFGIDKKGEWIGGNEAEEILKNQTVVSSPHTEHFLDPKITSQLNRCDFFLPILHGTYGEDGTIQGFFEMLGKPYMGPDCRAASIAMDKVLTKHLVAQAGVLVPKDLHFGRVEWMRDKERLLRQIKEELCLPFYIKPVHLGSSVGISKVDTLENLQEAIDCAFRFDTHVMVEEGKVNCRELEFAVIGNTDGFRVDAPPPGEKLAQGEFVDYQKKYGNSAVNTTLYPDLSPEIIKKGQQLAKKAYLATSSSVMTRVDFLLDQEGNYWFFEMNPIPGMQKMSLFPKIWQREGVEPRKLFDKLIIFALQRRRAQDRHFMTLKI